MKKRKLILSIIICVILASLMAFSAFILIKSTPENADNPEADISYNISANYAIKIIDGDTFKLKNGDIIRLICVDAPEKGKKGYEEAKEFLTGMILGKEVRLEKDVSDKDEYGRLLRYAYVSISGAELFVNKQLVQEGHASVFRYGNDTKRCGEIEGKEQ